jgi:MoaA/NifB/PqqE/SkfB family radical SAM enzyme
MNIDDQYIKHLRGLIDRDETNPFFLKLVLTNDCNLKCTYCLARIKKSFIPNAEMNEKKIRSIAKEAVSLGIKRVMIIGGGEALIRKNLFVDLVKLLKKNKKIHCSLHTNGTLFTEEIIKLLVQYRFDDVFISLDSHDKRTNDFLRGQGTFDRINEALDLFKKWKKELGTELPLIRITPVISSKNYNHFFELIDFAKKKKIAEIRPQPIIIPSYAKIGKNLILRDKQKIWFNSNLSKLKEYSRKKKIWNTFEHISKDIVDTSEDVSNIILKRSMDFYRKYHKNYLRVPCFEPWSSIGIHSDGNVSPCSLIERDFSLNIENSSLKEIWHSAEYERLRVKFLSGHIEPLCRYCCGAKLMEVEHFKQLLIKEKTAK